MTKIVVKQYARKSPAFLVSVSGVGCAAALLWLAVLGLTAPLWHLRQLDILQD